MNICNYRLLIKNHRNLWLTIALITLTLLAKVRGKPQDIFESAAGGAALIAGQAADIISNGGAVRNDQGFEVPFAKVHSKNEAGVGEAMRQKGSSDSSSSSSSSEEDDDDRRRKRSLDTVYNELAGAQSLQEMESLMSIQPHYHYHRSKRASCHGGAGAGGGGGGGAGGTGTGADYDYDLVDGTEAERRRRRRQKAARKRKANQSKSKSKKTNRNTKKSLIGEDDGAAQADETLRRRKRQSEVDDLNSKMNQVSKNTSDQTQQFAQAIQGIWENFVNSMNQIGQRIKETFKNASSGGGDQTTGDI